MSSTTTPHRQTFWCHECDMSVSLISTPSSPLCPYCRSDFLEHLDPNVNTLTNTNSLHPNNNNNFLDPFSTDDNFMLDSPYLHRLIHHLTNSNNSDDSEREIHVGPSQGTARSAIEAIPRIKITESMILLESVIFCAVCKEQFVVDTEATQLPCNHIYHEECILPWLTTRNSCPLCRYKMPTESGSEIKVRSRRDRFGDFLGDDEFYGFGHTLRHIARRHRLVFPVSSSENGGDVEGSVEAEIGVLGRENSVETVSSGWPNWPVQAQGGDQEVGASGRENDGAGAVL